MSLISEQLKKEKNKKATIEKKVDTEVLKVNEDEIRTTAEIIRDVSRELSDEFSGKGDLPDEEIKKLVAKKCHDLRLGYEAQKRIEKNVLMTALGNGPIEPLLKDDSVTEIIVQRYNSILVERNGKLEDTDITFNNDEHLMTIINRIVQSVGRQINISKPIVDARLKDGSRVNAMIPPASPDGPELVIRKFSKNALTGKDYLALGSMDKNMLYFLNRCVTGRVSIFVSGGTGTGKTTLLNMLSSYIPSDESIITIEDVCELQLQQPRVRRREVRTNGGSDMMVVDQQALVKAALRQRPDRIILGETRDGSIVDLISAMSTGHDGSMSTIHANSPSDMVNIRIPILYSMNRDVNFSERSISMQVAAAVKLVCQIRRYGSARKVDRITEITGTDENGKVTLEDIFVYNSELDRYEATGYIPEDIIKSLADKGIEVDRSIFRSYRLTHYRYEKNTGSNMKTNADENRGSSFGSMISSVAGGITKKTDEIQPVDKAAQPKENMAAGDSESAGESSGVNEENETLEIEAEFEKQMKQEEPSAGVNTPVYRENNNRAENSESAVTAAGKAKAVAIAANKRRSMMEREAEKAAKEKAAKLAAEKEIKSPGTDKPVTEPVKKQPGADAEAKEERQIKQSPAATDFVLEDFEDEEWGSDE